MRTLCVVALLLAAASLLACGGGGSGSSSGAYTVSVSVSGLQAGKTVTLLDNGTDSLPVAANGTLAFATMLSSGAAYAVTVATQPVGQTCTVESGSGTIGTNNVLVGVICSTDSYTVGGSVSGLISGTTLTLQDGQGGQATITTNGTYAFNTSLPSGTSYTVSLVSPPAGESCAVANATGTVAGSNVTNANVSCSGLPYTINAVVTGLTNVNGLILQNNGSDDLVVAVSGNYSFTTQVASGHNYQVTILAQPSGHTCNVVNGAGTVGSSNVTVVVACPWHVGYAISSAPAASGILAYYVDQSTGATHALAGNPFGAGTSPTAIVVSPSAGLLYATGSSGSGSTILAYHINPIDGSLTPVAGSPFAVANFPSVLAIDPQNRFLYVGVGNQGSYSIAAFTINSASGALSAVTGSPFAVEGAPLYLTVSAAGFVYAGYPDSVGNARVAAFAITSGTGVLTEITGSPFLLGALSAGWDLNAFAIDPLGRFFYAVGQNGFGIPEGAFYAVNGINSTTGALTSVAGSPFDLNAPTAEAMTSIVIDQTGSYFYGGGPFDDVVVEFSINSSTGVLTSIGTLNVPGSVALTAVDPSNTFLFGTNSVYAPNPTNLDSPYTINHSTGGLTLFLNGTTDVQNAAPIAFSTTP